MYFLDRLANPAELNVCVWQQTFWRKSCHVSDYDRHLVLDIRLTNQKISEKRYSLYCIYLFAYIAILHDCMYASGCVWT
jgi:hypothetical protein